MEELCPPEGRGCPGELTSYYQRVALRESLGLSKGARVKVYEKGTRVYGLGVGVYRVWGLGSVV